MRFRSVSVVLLVALAALVWAQERNPRGNATTTIAGKKITVDYGRPSLKGRTFDELIKDLPEDRMWRAGENQVTTLATEGDIVIGGKKVPAGKYSLYVHCPVNGNYQLVLNGVLGQPLGKVWDQAPENLKNEPWPHFAYTSEIGDKEVVRVDMKRVEGASSTDPFTVSFAPAGDGAVMNLGWGDRSWNVEVKPAS